MNVRYRRREPFEKISKFDKSYHKSMPIPSDEDLDQASYNQCTGATYINSIVSVYRPVSPINTIHISQRPSITKRFNKRWKR